MICRVNSETNQHEAACEKTASAYKVALSEVIDDLYGKYAIPPSELTPVHLKTTYYDELLNGEYSLEDHINSMREGYVIRRLESQGFTYQNDFVPQ